MKRPIPTREVSRVENVSNVVRLPNPRKIIWVQSQTHKGSLPQNKRNKGRVLKRKEELVSPPTLSELLERKNMTKQKIKKERAMKFDDQRKF